VDTIYVRARVALYATLDDDAIRDVATRPMFVRTAAASREAYLAAPPLGERLREDDAQAIASARRGRPPQVQIVVSDGLNANAVNEQLRAILPAVRHTLTRQGRRVSDTDIVVSNGRVRAGYEIGGCVATDVIVHLIGERPGTGLNALSAYVTYGRDSTGMLRWSRDLNHSATTAICGIHPHGKRADLAVAEIARAVAQIVSHRCSGVALTALTGPNP
jgi:ethanolamine ammonia-lyase small subunit